MGQFFTIRELTDSDTASKRGIDNTPGGSERQALTRLIDNCLDPIRRMWGGPITVNSGYRCDKLNAAVGGVPTSQHRLGEAADITAGSPQENKELFEKIRYSNIQFDQLIDEKGYAWVHVSYREGRNRKQVLHL